MKIKLIIISFFIGFQSCGLIFPDRKPTIDDPRVIRSAEIRINNYIKGKIQSCSKRILVDAETHVDTTLARKIDELLLLDTDFPEKPDRPETTEKISVESDFTPTPLFIDTIPQLDSLILNKADLLQLDSIRQDSI